tara:strand:- start:3 stop:797 length:795 start_codon:yes stop_codon:yes gene_type:complete
MSLTVIKATLKSGKFRQHKKNPKGNTLIFSRNHPTEKFVRIVVDSGIDKNTGKIVSQPSVSSVFININKHWREIVSAHKGTNLSGLINVVESKACSAAKCKHCGAKKFKAKSGNVVCANACWTKWSGNKKKTTQKTTQKKPQKNPPQIKAQKSSQKKRPRNLQRKATKKLQEKWSINLQPGDLVTVEECTKENNIAIDYSGKILGIVASVHSDAYGTTRVQWTANTSSLEEWELPKYAVEHRYKHSLSWNRFKVVSRKVNWVKA